MNTYTKIHALAAFAVAILLTFAIMFILPQQKKNEEILFQKTQTISMHYDVSTNTYDNYPLVNKLQEEVIQIRTEQTPFRICVALLYIGIWMTLIPILANWMQYLYTDIQFTDRPSILGEKILSTSLQCSTIIVALVYYLTFQ